MSGPLSGVRVVEIAGLGPGPFAAMVLADLGADVLRVDRPGGGALPAGMLAPNEDVLNRGRRSVAIDLKNPEGAEVVLRLAQQADALIEGFRPGVTERLGIGPEVCLERNPRLIYGRMTGWGQDGPYAQVAGHDLNYIGVAGPLGAIGRAGQLPTPPLALVGDFGGGGMLLALGIAAALVEASKSGRGQVIDSAIVDGAALLATPFISGYDRGVWSLERGTNSVDSGAPWYDVYETADGKMLAVAAMEPRFYAALLALLGLDHEDLPDQMDQTAWPAMRARFAAILSSRTRDEWWADASEVPACVTPVLTFDELGHDPHLAARQSLVRVDGMLQSAPAPRFSRTPADLSHPPASPGEHTKGALVDWGFAEDEIAELALRGAVAVTPAHR
jgi:alpha-methylacyl-CoA racemase